jgi:hypothetical protein
MSRCNIIDVKTNVVNTAFIRDNAQKILDAATVGYLKSAKLRGSLFQENAHPGVISSIYTEFFVDHKEPLEALENFKAAGRGWCLGELLDGHEFLLILPICSIGVVTEPDIFS